MAFTVGQKVVCVDASPDLEGRAFIAKLGSIYTIDKIEICTPGYPCCGLVFMQIDDRPRCSDRFRPIVERKTDISIFTKMLTSLSERV